MISETDAAYIAGLFDGEGHIQYKQYMRQRKNNKKNWHKRENNNDDYLR